MEAHVGFNEVGRVDARCPQPCPRRPQPVSSQTRRRLAQSEEDQPAERREELARTARRTPAHGIENQIDPSRTHDGSDLSVPRLPRQKTALGTQLPFHVPTLLLRAGGGEHAHVRPVPQLNRGGPHSAGAAQHQQSLSSTRRAGPKQAHPGGKEDHGEAGGLCWTHTARPGKDLFGRDDYLARVSPMPQECDHALTRMHFVP